MGVVVVVSALSELGDSFDVLPPGSAVAAFERAFHVAAWRSPDWEALARSFVRDHPACACCGAVTDLQVHHILPFHLRPDLELDRDNLLVLCRRCHLLIGHLGSWTSWNPAVRADAVVWNRKIVSRP